MNRFEHDQLVLIGKEMHVLATELRVPMKAIVGVFERVLGGHFLLGFQYGGFA